MMHRRWSLLLVFLAVMLIFPAAAKAASEKTLFEAAEKARAQFQDDKKARQLRHKWVNVIEGYEKVLAKNPDGEYAERSLLAVGDLYYGLYDISRRESDAGQAFETYRRLVKRFPKSGLSARAQLRIGDIYYRCKADPDRAYAELLKVELNYPGSKDEINESRRLMADISGTGRYEKVDLPESHSPAKPEEVEAAPANGKAVVKGIRYWHNQTYSRVAIDLDREVRFKDHLLPRNQKLDMPMRLYMDIENCMVARDITDEMTISDGMLSRARVAQFDPNTVRVVLDLQDIYNYRIFSLSNPFRIVVDVTAKNAETTVAANDDSNAPGGKEAEEEKRKAPLSDLRQTALKRPKKPRGPLQESSKQASLARQLGLGIRKVVIDPGHGGKDCGASGVSGMEEKDLTLAVARLLARKIRDQLGLEVSITRDRDVFLTLEERTARANTEAADLFISIHANAHQSPGVHGIETYVLNIATDQEAMRVAARENATTTRNMSDLQVILSDLMLNSKISESSRLGSLVHRSTVSRIKKSYRGIRDLGVKQAPFYVLIGANMPSILVELGFITNKSEEGRLKTKKYQEIMTDGILEGIKAYQDSFKKAS